MFEIETLLNVEILRSSYNLETFNAFKTLVNQHL